MGLSPDLMARRVRKLLVTLSGDEVARYGVDLAPLHSRSYLLCGKGDRVSDRLERGRHLCRRLRFAVPEEVPRSLHVGAVFLGPRAKVDVEDVSLIDLPVGRPGVGSSRIGPCEYRRAHIPFPRGLHAPFIDQIEHEGGELLLRHPRFYETGDTFEYLLSQIDVLLYPPYFLGALAAPELRHDFLGRDDALRPGSRL